QAVICDQRDQISSRVQLGKVIQTSLSIIKRAAVGERRSKHGLDRLVGSTRVTRESNLSIVFWVEQVSPVLGNLWLNICVHEESQNAIVIAIPIAFSVL